MHSERIVSLSLAAIILLLVLINAFSKDEMITEAAIERLVEEEYRFPSSVDEIEPIDSIVRPILYSDVDFLDDLPTQEVKRTFINIMVPAILIAKKELDFTKEQVEKLVNKGVLDDLDSAFLLPLMTDYRAESIDELVRRMHTHPTSIVLGQAAIESGWGRSRFFKEANNVFGVWSMNPNEDRIPAQIRRTDRQVYLKSYPDISASIKDYFLTIGKVNAYKSFRQARLRSSDYKLLIPYLDKYSERGEDYVADLARMIRVNGFEQYDAYQLDPDFVSSVK